jgi:hypothetical protein
VKKYCESKFEVWSELKDQSISEKWCEMFTHFTKLQYGLGQQDLDEIQRISEAPTRPTSPRL